MRIADMNAHQLSWVVTLIELERAEKAGEHVKRWVAENIRKGEQVDPYATDWMWAGPIIEREGISWHCGNKTSWHAYGYGSATNYNGPTPLIAAMRCYAASVKGDFCELPQLLRKPA